MSQHDYLLSSGACCINKKMGPWCLGPFTGFALHHGLLRIIQLSLLGSVVSNLLLVLGSAFIAGGLRGKSQSFNQEVF